MLKTIFFQGEPSQLPALCAVGECLDPDTSHCNKAQSSTPRPESRWWATGMLIHPRVVLTAAHSRRSDTVLGDRVLLPQFDISPKSVQKGKPGNRTATKPFPERHLCVQRIHDYPKSRTQAIDARLLILMEPTKPDESQNSELENELKQRVCLLKKVQVTDETEMHIDGFENLHSMTPGQPLPTTRSRLAKLAEDAHRRETHGHVPGQEFVITPQPVGSERGERSVSTAAFGDSGAPVWIGEAPHLTRVVGMYVRRSLNRPAATNPDLVVLAWNDQLEGWVKDVMNRYGLSLL